MKLVYVCCSLLIAIRQGLKGASSGSSGVLDRASDASSCSQVRLKPAGQCEDEDECPYQLILPSLTIQLPKQFRLLEKTMKELQSLKETVNRMKISCQECGSQKMDVQKDSGDPLSGNAESRGDIATRVYNNGNVSNNDIVQDMQVKMNRMSNSLKNARVQINSLQGRLEEINLLNLDNVEEIVDRKVENITGMVNKISRTCTSQLINNSLNRNLKNFPLRDCSDITMVRQRTNGVYNVTPDPRNGSFPVYCDMESFGGGWTVIQQRINGRVSFNRTWIDYKKGFGDLNADLWLGNDKIHLLTKSKDMVLRIELEDFDGTRGYAKYDQFYVSNEFLRYRLSVSGYSGTAGNALQFSKQINHDQKFFSTPDRDNDMYPSGNCGAYYGSGWWFDACMSANPNGKYYKTKYKGKRDGIFWGTWHNLTSEYYPTNYRQAFKRVKMMIRPKNYAP
ncbi:Fibroleukin Fibrinogen-like protein 2 pT49 [Triplophysa tibetana]|uniref:Fibroleukin Fibrinogen-like protein 2 pT49 n=1 Tax=Triplophysa tibetana TaxID=1572043 RepID=A0A5A9PJD2_9TELE|nr:Fibroleukin Fibrinogen-like protein 2 pT49 [Triplophysa tibetana]